MLSVNKEHDRLRQEYNRRILRMISDKVEKHPYLRFGQILVNCGVIEDGKDPFYDEPWEIYHRMKRYASKEETEYGNQQDNNK